MRRPGALLCLLVGGCQSQGEDDSHSASLGTVRGRLTDMPMVLSGSRLRVGIVWAASPEFVPYCHEFGPNGYTGRQAASLLAAAACRDPFDFVPALAGPSAPLEQDLTFQIPLAQLPPARVMVGSKDERVAYASIVLFDDVDGDGALRLGLRCRFGRGTDSGEAQELIYAASFASMLGPHTRLTLVEGRFDAESFFYPHSNCRNFPGPGFWLWSMGPLYRSDDDCRLESLEAEVLLEPMSPLSKHLACPQRSRETFLRPPPETWSIDDSVWECVPQGMAAASDCGCPDLRVFALSGCYDDLGCTVPDWDLSASPPSWWPCQP